jgi:hypothetical protein
MPVARNDVTVIWRNRFETFCGLVNAPPVRMAKNPQMATRARMMV